MATREIDWSQCQLVDVKTGAQGGTPARHGSTIPVSAIVYNFNEGDSVDEVAEQFGISSDHVEAILSVGMGTGISAPIRWLNRTTQPPVSLF
jgi:uncharacterized protein (DUF433 family)